jgi:hypothetical protein
MHEMAIFLDGCNEWDEIHGCMVYISERGVREKKGWVDIYVD